MAIITLPNNLKLRRMTVGQKRFDLSFDNSETGASSTRLLGPPRWSVSFNSNDDMDVTEASAWVALMLQLRGRVNHLAVWDVLRPVPRGSMRGTMTLASSAPAGATSIQVTAGASQANKTLLAADWLQIGLGVGTSQLVAVVADAIADASGVITVNVEPPLRRPMAAGTTVTWDKPVAYYKSTTSDTSWTAERANQGTFSFDGIERWEA